MLSEEVNAAAAKMALRVGGVVDLASEPDDSSGDVSKFERINVIVLIAVVVIAASILFETLQERLYELLRGEQRKVLTSLFEELTLLGFVSLLIFVASKAGLGKMSTALFGESHEDELEEVVEDVHMFIFFFMVLYLTTVLTLLAIQRRITRVWRALERASHSPGLVAVEFAKSGLDYIGCCRLELSMSEATLVYTSLRIQFLRSLANLGVFFRKTTADSRSPCESSRHEHEGSLYPCGVSFDFATYLTRILSRELAALIKISVRSWLVLLVIVVSLAYCGAAKWDVTVGVVFGCGCLLPVGLGLFLVYCRRIVLQLVNPALRVYAESLSDERAAGFSPEGMGAAHGPARRSLWPAAGTAAEPLLPDLEMLSTPPVHHPLVFGPSGAAWDRTSPRYILAPQPKAPSGCFARALGPLPPNKHEALFFFGRRGPAFARFLLRLCIILNAVYLAVGIAVIFGEGRKYDLTVAIVVQIVYLVPAAIFVYMIPSVLRQYCIATSVEQLKSNSVIDKVVRENRTKQSLRVLRLLLSLKAQDDVFRQARAATASAGLAESKEGGSSATPQRRVSMKVGGIHRRRQDLFAAFMLFDTDGDGQILAADLQNLLSALGSDARKEVVEAAVSAVDANGDGVITFDEFFEWSQTLEDGATSEDVERAIMRIFDAIDRDQSGSISAAELASTLNTVCPGLSHDDVLELVREFDADEDGVINREEFKELLLKHLDR